MREEALSGPTELVQLKQERGAGTAEEEEEQGEEEDYDESQGKMNGLEYTATCNYFILYFVYWTDSWQLFMAIIAMTYYDFEGNEVKDCIILRNICNSYGMCKTKKISCSHRIPNLLLQFTMLFVLYLMY